MSESASAAGLHEYIDEEIQLGEPGSPAQEELLRDSLAGQKGVQQVVIAPDKIAVHYEPLFVRAKEIIAAIERAGFKIKNAHATLSSPLTDALAGQLRSGSGNSLPNE